MAEIAETRPAEQLANELNMLAHNGASGALRIVGRPGGVVYLKNGYLTYAETSAVPDLGTRLVRSGCLTADDWRQVSQAGQPGLAQNAPAKADTDGGGA